MIEKSIQAIISRLSVPVNEGRAILRFDLDGTQEERDRLFV